MIELLAPAGTYESFLAAVSAGADAVYLGGTMFGARAFAGNFDTDQLLQAIDYAHIHDRKVYLTVNTLLKERELKECLYEYILPFYREGLDAVIVQDYGVFSFLREYFPDMDIHASTQMTIAGPAGAALLQKAGAKRIVTPRELTLEEIADIRRKNPTLEIESFVHGALCYCYSGQCLMSSLIGARSGNRGRCAQACRLAYDVYRNGACMNKESGRYVLSPRDMCALQLLPQLLEAGVDSLKIEGRMKSPEYTAGVVSVYRRYVDMYLEHGKDGFSVRGKDIQDLMDLYNRGSFTKGYYTEKNGRQMMSMKRPNHQGVAALEVVSIQKGSFLAKPLTQLNAGDVIEITPEYEITIGAKDAGQPQLSYRIPAKFSVKKGQVLYRTRNQSLLAQIRQKYMEHACRRFIEMQLCLQCDRPARLLMTAGEICVQVEGAICLNAEKQPVTEEQLERQLGKLGATEFEAEKIRIDMQENVFLPMSAVNDLRRQGVEALRDALIKAHYRKEMRVERKIQNNDTAGQKNPTAYSAYITRIQQAAPVAESGIFDRVYLDFAVCPKEQLYELVQKLRKSVREVFFAFPQVFRKTAEAVIDEMLPVIRECGFDGFLVKSLCEISYIHDKKLNGKVVTDHNMYVWNHAAKEFLFGQGADCLTVPVELNEREIEELHAEGMEIIGYGYYPMMISAQCVRKNLTSCKKGSTEENEIWYLKDRKAKSFPVSFDCTQCCCTIYNECPVVLLDRMETFQNWGISHVRVQFTVEDQEQITKIISCIRNGDFTGINRTNGHFTRGVE